MALVDLDLDVKPWLEIPSDETGSDDVLLQCMEGATGYFERYCDRVLELQTLTLQFNGTGTHVLPLREWPIKQLWRVAIDPTWQFLTPEDPTTILVDNEAFIVTRDVWPQGIRNVQVTFDAGFDTEDAPADLRQASLMMIEFLYRSRADERIGVTNRGKLGESLTFQDSVPKAINDILTPYMWVPARAGLLRRVGGG